MDWVPDPRSAEAPDLPAEVAADLELLAERVHDVWSSKRLAEGWRYGPERSSADMTNPSLVPFAQLPQDERDYDRAMVTATIGMLLDLGYRIARDPGPGGTGRDTTDE